MANFQLPPHVGALRCMMVEGGGDGRVMPPELVGEVMGYCGTPILRLDGPSEEVATKLDPFNLEYAFIDDGELYHIVAVDGDICAVGSHTRECLYMTKDHTCQTHLRAWCYDSEHRRLFISYSYGHGRGFHYELIGYSFPQSHVFFEMNLDTFSMRDLEDCSFCPAEDILYLTFLSPVAVDVYYIRWAESKVAKLAYSLAIPASGEPPITRYHGLYTFSSAPSSVDVLYMTNSICHHVKLSMVRSDRLIKFEASRSLRAKAEGFEGRLIPILGSKPPLYVSRPRDGGTCHLRSANELRKLAEFDLGTRPPDYIIVDGRWTLGCLNQYYHLHRRYFHFMRFHPYVDE
ncbi:hypothetical protein FOZ61_003816 [Perkinsus olseni]|uniref:Uncharacterized protein n=1 Tax=Perkinsus olseni TaxID=32597 RepID=A0A7J6LKE4_PEROL|nr:hypothetical protein FOL46_006456 [Perkinsus olseni]KAF4660723.1 hypothetical protein FOZ61_003816 [Perkinsus olseni]